MLVVVTHGLADAAPPPFLGKWKLEAVRTKSGPVPKDKLAGGGMTWEFKSGGSLVMTVWKGTESKTVNAKWVVDGSTLSVDEDGKVQKMTVKKVGAKLEIAGIPPASTVVMTFARTK